MKLLRAFFISLIVCLAACSPNSYIYRSEQQINTPDNTLYTDNDLYSLIMHNFGLLPQSQNSLSVQQIINKYGEENLLAPSKINFVVILENEDEGLDYKGDLASKHQGVSSEICNQNENNKCLVDMLEYSGTSFGQSLLIPEAFDDQYEIYMSTGLQNHHFRSSKVELDILNQSVSLFNYKLSESVVIPESLEDCFNKAVNVLSSNDYSQIRAQHPDEFKEFMRDMCAMNLISSKQPANLLVFYLDSYHQLSKLLTNEQKPQIKQMLFASYENMINNLLSFTSKNEVSGQLISLTPSNLLSQKMSGTSQQFKILQTLAQPAVPTPGAGLTPQQFQSCFSIPFFLIGALILIGLFNMEVYRDSLVYSKFLPPEGHGH